MENSGKAPHSNKVTKNSSKCIDELKQDISLSSFYGSIRSGSGSTPSSSSESKLYKSEISNENPLFKTWKSKIVSFPNNLATSEANFDEITECILLTEVIPQNELRKYLL